MNVLDSFCQGGVRCSQILSLGINEGSLGGEGGFKFVDSVCEKIFRLPVGGSDFFQLVRLQGFCFLEAGNLFLKAGNLGCVLSNP